MKKTLLVLSTSLLLVSPTLAFADSDHSQVSEHKSQTAIQAQLNHEGNHDANESENEASEHASEKSVEAKTSFSQSGNSFEVRGKITSVSPTGDFFIVDGKVITLDPTITHKYIQKGNIVVGAFARVKGIIVDGTLYATEVKIEAQGTFGHPPARVKIIVPATSSATHSATASAEISVRGPLDAVIKFLENLLGLLKNVI